MIIGASSFIGFVAYATVQTSKISDEINTIPEIATIEETITPYEDVTILPTKTSNKNISPEPIVNSIIKESPITDPIITQYEEENIEKESRFSKYYEEEDDYEQDEEEEEDD